MASQVEVYQRADDRWAWRLRSGNGQIIATDGGQGYENEADCARIATAIVDGDYGSPNRSTMLPLIIAIACLGRGLTAEETQHVADIIEATPTPSTAAEAHALIESAIADELAASRGVIL